MTLRTVLSSIGISLSRCALAAISGYILLASASANPNLVASGVAWPAFNLAPDSNPVGALYMGRTIFSLQASTVNPLSSQYTVGGRFGTLLGRSAAAMAGANLTLQGGGLQFPYALAIGGRKIAFGIGGDIRGTHNLGVLFGPLSKTRFGIIWSNFMGLSASGIALGLASQMGRSITLGVDVGSAFYSINTWSIRPGLMVSAGSLTIQGSYGGSIGPSGFVVGGPSGGFSLATGRFIFQGLFNTISTFFLSLTTRL